VGVLERNNVTVSGRPDGPVLLFAHGFGCDQHMWRHVAPAFADTHRIVLFDHVGSGRSDLTAYDPARYGSLDGYARDILEICHELELQDVVLVGHSVAAMMGVLAAAAEPGRFAGLVLVAPSPRYVDDDGYSGGLRVEDVEGLLSAMDGNYLGWAAATAPMIMGRPDAPELGEELASSFCQADPDIARQFARVTFLADNRSDLERVTVPTLVLQCSDDVLAPPEVGDYVHEHIAGSTLVRMRATGHCPNLSAPDETVEAIAAFLGAVPG
jgi:sigma-B regulation protein RsbQ